MTTDIPFHPHDRIPAGLVTITDMRQERPPRVLKPGARPVAVTRFPGAATLAHLYERVDTTPVTTPDR